MKLKTLFQLIKLFKIVVSVHEVIKNIVLSLKKKIKTLWYKAQYIFKQHPSDL